jgi:hypothetical protein
MLREILNTKHKMIHESVEIAKQNFIEITNVHRQIRRTPANIALKWPDLWQVDILDHDRR